MKIRTALQEFDWKGWLGWMAVTLAGVELVALSIIFSLVRGLDKYWWGYLATASAAGISLGVCQWIWLRRRLVKAWWWIVSTLLGWYLAALLVMVLDANDSNATGILRQLVGAIGTLAIPLALSLPQWFFIRRQFQKRAWWWIVARPLAWLAGLGLIVVSDYIHILPPGDLFLPFDPSSLWSVSIFFAIFGFGFAAVTGAAFTSIQTNQTGVRSHGAAGS